MINLPQQFGIVMILFFLAAVIIGIGEKHDKNDKEFFKATVHVWAILEWLHLAIYLILC